jgi:hypothetical protein
MMHSIFNPGWAKISLNASSPALAAETSAKRLPARTVIDTPLQRIIAHNVGDKRKKRHGIKRLTEVRAEHDSRSMSP